MVDERAGFRTRGGPRGGDCIVGSRTVEFPLASLLTEGLTGRAGIRLALRLNKR